MKVSQQTKQLESQLRQVITQLRGAERRKQACLFVTSVGNPEPEYANTRHNAGHFMLDSIRRHMRLGKYEEKTFPNAALTLYKEYPGLVLVKSHTFMNNSGAGVLEAVKWFEGNYDYDKVVRRFLVIHDDLDLELGDVRLRLMSRANRGHNGLRSISATIPDPFHRIRVGIGRPETRDTKTISNYVLGKFSREELDKLAFEGVPTLLDYVQGILDSGVLVAENAKNR
jgi:PTH1 family peptidyl-tRNA hydrolase